MSRQQRRGRACPGFVVLAVLIVGAGVACQEQAPAAAVVFSGRFVTLDPEQPEVEALAVRDGRIVALGSRDEVASAIGPDTREIELPGVGLPGFAEAHGHAEGVGRQLELLDLQRASKEKILELVAEAAGSAEPGEWIQGRGWDQGFWAEPEFPTAADLDDVAPDNPVVLTRIGGHATWVNSRALELAEITASTANPEGGRIVRDEAGNPTGILVDEAEGLVSDVVPPSTREDRERRLRAALDQYVRWGVTSVHDAGVDLEGIQIYKDLLAADELPLRVYAMPYGRGESAEHYLESGPEIGLGDQRLTMRSFKVLLDGALGSRGAQLQEPYADAPSETGLVVMQDEAFENLIRRAGDSGFQVAAHAIGDLAVRRALDAYEAAAPEFRDLRPRVEHVSIVRPEDVPRFEALGVIASMQPVFVGEYSRWALERLGPERIDWVYPTRQILETGAVVASGTDFPASDSGDPIVTLYSLVTRKGLDGKPEGGFVPDESVGVEQALHTMTMGAAYAAFQEEDLGMLAMGRLADLTVLSDDPRSTPPEDLRSLEVLATVVGGEVVFRAD